MVRSGLVAGGLLASSVIGSTTPVTHADTGNLTLTNQTTPFGGVFIPDSLGGHVWFANAANGLCRLDMTLAGPALNACDTSGAVKAPAQATYDPVNQRVYVADKHSNSLQVVRFTFNPTTATLSSPSTLSTPFGVTSPRPDGVALSADGRHLYVGALKSNAIVDIQNPSGLNGGASASIVAFDSDKANKGANSLTMISHTDAPGSPTAGAVHNDLYLSEIGGSGVTVIQDITGVTDPATGASIVGACTSQNQCIAVPTAITSQFPGAITSDGSDLIFVGDAPRLTTATTLRYRVSTDTQDIIGTNINMLLPPPGTVTCAGAAVGLLGYVAAFDGNCYTQYKGINGLTFVPPSATAYSGLFARGGLFVGDDPTIGLAAPPVGQGHVWSSTGALATTQCAVGALSVQLNCVDALGSAGVPAQLPPPPAPAKGSLWAWGITAPKGGSAVLPSADGGHRWGSDHASGVCRFDAVAGSNPVDYALNPAACDPGFTVGSPGQMTLSPVQPDGTYFVFVPDNAVRSPGVWRLKYDPNADPDPVTGKGRGMLSNPVLMAPGKLPNLKPNGTAWGPDGKLYVGDLIDGNVRRISNPAGDPRSQTVEIPYQTNDLRGINGTMSFLGNYLFLPENNAATFFDVTQCPIVTPATATSPATVTPCQFTDPAAKGGGGGVAGPNNIPDNRLPLAKAGLPVFVSGIATDASRNLVYAASSPGAANAIVFRFPVAAGAFTGTATPNCLAPLSQQLAGQTCTTPTGPATQPPLATFYTSQGQLPLAVDPVTGVTMTGGLGAAATAGAGSLVLPSWVKQGTVLVLDNGLATQERVTVLSISFNGAPFTANLTTPLQFAHAAGATVQYNPDFTVTCTITCTRPNDPAPPNGLIGYVFAQGLSVDNRQFLADGITANPDWGALFISDDPTAGNRSQRGHAYRVPLCTPNATNTGCL